MNTKTEKADEKKLAVALHPIVRPSEQTAIVAPQRRTLSVGQIAPRFQSERVKAWMAEEERKREEVREKARKEQAEAAKRAAATERASAERARFPFD